jgi:tRNA pseudouridine55 synthase
MDGILVIDKSKGLSSFDVVRRVRRLAGTRRVGHAGTLDPLATGVLPVAIGWTTRLIEYLMGAEKVYRTTLCLGSETDTQDSEGKVLATAEWQQVDLAAVEQVVRELTGAIQQVPPMYSALKRDGVPLYRLARQGVEVERAARDIFIRSIEIESFEPPFVKLCVTCSKGTYIRTLCHDLGRKLGCCAHMTELRRVRNGLFTEQESWSLESLEQMAEEGDALPLLSPAEALSDWPELVIDGPVLDRLLNGVAPDLCEVETDVSLELGQAVRCMTGGELVALARYAPDRPPEKLGSFQILKVFPQVMGR